MWDYITGKQPVWCSFKSLYMYWCSLLWLTGLFSVVFCDIEGLFLPTGLSVKKRRLGWSKSLAETHPGLQTTPGRTIKSQKRVSGFDKSPQPCHLCECGLLIQGPAMRLSNWLLQVRQQCSPPGKTVSLPRALRTPSSLSPHPPQSRSHLPCPHLHPLPAAVTVEAG